VIPVVGGDITHPAENTDAAKRVTAAGGARPPAAGTAVSAVSRRTATQGNQTSLDSPDMSR
jgi:hypothetical protein